MAIEDTLYSTLVDDADVGPLVLDNGIYQVFKGFPPQGYPTQKPYIVITVVFGNRASTFSGLSTLKNARVQVDSFGETYSSVRTLADHIYDAVDTNMSVGDSNEQAFFEDDTQLHRLMVEFSLWE